MTRPILTLTELVPGVHVWRRVSNGGIVPFGDPGARPGLLLIDTGADDRAAAGLIQWIERFRAERVVIAQTHGHRDHAWGSAALLARGAELLAVPAGDGAELGWGNGQCLNGLEVKVLALPGHTPDSRAVIVRGVAFAGDAVFAPEILRRMPIPAYLDVERALASLEALAGWLQEQGEPAPPGGRWLVPGHGRPLQGAAAVDAVAGTRAAAERALAHLGDLLGPPGFGPAPVPTDEDVRDWLASTGTAAQHAGAFGVWRRVATAYARELARRRALSAP